jgi:hypothetical protein
VKKIGIFCTYCSKSKAAARDLLPAISRYKSDRIERVAELAKRAGFGFVILSGRFGIVEPLQLLPPYDHLLEDSEVSAMSRVVAKQLVNLGIRHLVYFTESVRTDPNIAPYLNLIQLACESANIDLEIREWKG